MESFFSSLKSERAKRKIYRTRIEAKADMFDYIQRLHKSLALDNRQYDLMEAGMQVGLA